jgi:fucose permease
MHYGLALAGLGTALLGPILPLVAHNWHLLDAQSGLLMTAKFCGAFLGGFTVSKNLHRSLLVGMFAGAVGFGLFAISPGIQSGCIGLFIGGYGIGQLITAINIVAGRRFTRHRGSALALLNFFFSLGAMLSALLAGWLLPIFSLLHLLEGFAGTFLLGGLWLLIELSIGHAALPESNSDPTSSPASSLSRKAYLYFATLLILYGGLETCLSGWLTTYALRYGDQTFTLSAYTTLFFWLALTAGRAASSVLLLLRGDQFVQRIALVLAAIFTATLALAHSTWTIGACAVLLGLTLAPFFPATFSLLMAERPTARQAGTVIAVSGLGAAALPWLMGIVSTRTGSLQIALALPFAAALALLVLALSAKPEHDTATVLAAPNFPVAPGV